MAATSISYGTEPLDAFKVLGSTEGKVTLMSVGDHQVVPTPRFWGSLCSTFSTYGLSTKLFKLFTHEEVFRRISDVVGAEGKDRLRFALEESGGAHPSLLAVTNPNKPLVQYEAAKEVLARYSAEDAEYKEGIIRSVHIPANVDDIQIGGDGFGHQYVMETPIDGFGKPLIYLSLLRQVCSNGMIGYARAFRTDISIGRGNDDAADTTFSITRALDSFNNEEGYAALRQRFESATQSWASVYEVNRILKLVHKMGEKGMFTLPTTGGHATFLDSLVQTRAVVLGGDGASEDLNPATIKIMRGFRQMVGDLLGTYGVAHLDAISQKRMQKIPAKCTMYDLFNFVTEVATHYCSAKDGRLLQAELGNFISCEYDLEGTLETHPLFSDFFTKLDDNA